MKSRRDGCLRPVSPRRLQALKAMLEFRDVAQAAVSLGLSAASFRCLLVNATNDLGGDGYMVAAQRARALGLI